MAEGMDSIQQTAGPKHQTPSRVRGQQRDRSLGAHPKEEMRGTEARRATKVAEEVAKGMDGTHGSERLEK